MLVIYRCLTFILFPVFLIIVYLRAIFNKEDRSRYKEKIFSSCFRISRDKEKKLLWFHASSIGELLSILPLIEEINKNQRNINFLITTVTLSSSRLLEKKISKYNNITHRFFPLDTEILSKRFIAGWKPDLVCFVDSEIWPNFLFKIKEKNIPLVLINGRITKKTFNRWKKFPNFAKKTFNNFDLCLASSKDSEDNLRKLNIKNLKYIGNLKFLVENKKEHLNEYNKKKLNNFKVWCAASTHSGEELIALKTHLEIKKKYNNVLTIIIPRHINRASYIKGLTKKFNLTCQILNDNDEINTDNEILIVNSFGVLSKYFNYCKNIFIGKSFIKKLELVGGQNPIEAAKLGCKVFHGPYVYNFQEVYSLLKMCGISEQVNDEKELSDKIIKNIEKPQRKSEEQMEFLNTYGEKILRQTILQLNRFIK